MGGRTRLALPPVSRYGVSMVLRDHPVLNLLRRLRGWTRGDLRVMVEARADGQHFFRVYECRCRTVQEAEPLISAELALDGASLVEIAQERPATVPMPRRTRIVALSDRIYFGADALPIAPPAPQDVDPR